jgi:hypothetical protein
MIEILLPFAGKILDKFFPDPAQKAEAQVKLMELAQSGELAKMANETELYKTEQNNLTQRQQADMASDSWLSKNIRPMTLVYILVAYLMLAILDASVLDIADAFVELLGQWGMLVMSFYFGGRTLEKIIDIKNNNKGKE